MNAFELQDKSSEVIEKVEESNLLDTFFELCGTKAKLCCLRTGDEWKWGAESKTGGYFTPEVEKSPPPNAGDKETKRVTG